MPRRNPKKVPTGSRTLTAAELRKALNGHTKERLVEVLLDLAQDRKVLRQLISQLNLATTPDELVAATRQAIADATDFDDRDVNHNFDYDREAYEEVERNLSRLIEAGHLKLAMQLAVELMKDGSHQVEMSDEGIMTEDIEECLGVVLKALKKSDLAVDEIVAWCTEMLAADRVGFIADKEIEALQMHFQARARQPVSPFTKVGRSQDSHARAHAFQPWVLCFTWQVKHATSPLQPIGVPAAKGEMPCRNSVVVTVEREFPLHHDFLMPRHIVEIAAFSWLQRK